VKTTLGVGLKRNTVELHEHAAVWEEAARTSILELKEILGNKAVAIEHVGSTATKDIVAKPIIDIAIGLNNLEDIVPFFEELAKKGYRHIPQNDNQWQIFFSCGDFENDIRTHHIHAVIYNSIEWCNYLKFRDTLNSDAKLREEYAALKKTLCRKYRDDREAYTEAKADFIRKVLDS